MTELEHKLREEIARHEAERKQDNINERYDWYLRGRMEALTWAANLVEMRHRHGTLTKMEADK